MAFKPLRMDKRELIIEYTNQQFPIKKIARILGLSQNTVRKYIRDSKNQDKIQVTQFITEDLKDSITKEVVADHDMHRDNKL